MVEGLPPGGALSRAVNGHAWQNGDYTAADSRDLLAMLFTAFVNANRDPAKSPSPMPWPEPSWRPGDPLPEDTAAAVERDRAKARAAYEHILKQVKGE